MPRTADPFIIERNQRVVDEFERDNSQTYDEIARIVGISSQLVYNALREAGKISVEGRRKRVRLPEEIKTISAFHRQLGSDLERRVQDTILSKKEPELTKTSAARVLQLGSPQRLTLIYRGQEELTLGELSRCAAFLGYGSVWEMGSKLEEKLRSNIYGKKPASTGYCASSSATAALVTGK